MRFNFYKQVCRWLYDAFHTCYWEATALSVFIYGSNGLPVVNNLPSEIVGELVLPSGLTQKVSLPHSEGIPTPYFLLEFETPEEDQGICQLRVDSQSYLRLLNFALLVN